MTTINYERYEDQSREEQRCIALGVIKVMYIRTTVCVGRVLWILQLYSVTAELELTGKAM